MSSILPYLNQDGREKGKHIPRAVEGVNLSFSQESSGHVMYIPTLKKAITTNHVRFDESYFPYRTQSVIDGHVKERLESQLRVDSPVTWEQYDKTLPRNAYKKVHQDPVFDDLVMRVVNKPEIFA